MSKKNRKSLNCAHGVSTSVFLLLHVTRTFVAQVSLLTSRMKIPFNDQGAAKSFASACWLRNAHWHADANDFAALEVLYSLAGEYLEGKTASLTFVARERPDLNVSSVAII